MPTSGQVYLNPNPALDVQVDRTLDCRGKFCPLPIIQARRELDAMATGEVLEILTTDPGSWADFPAFARALGHELLDAREQDGAFTYYLRRSA